LRPATNSLSGSEIVAEQSSTPAVQASTPDAPQAAPVAQAAPDTIAAGAAPAVPSPDQQLLEAMARDLASVQQRVEKLATGQEKLARDIARLQAAEKDIRHKISVPPQPAATPAPKPMPMMPPEQAVPQASTAPPPPAQPTPPPTQLRPPEPVR